MRSNQCQTSNRLVYDVTLIDPGPGDPTERIIDPGHGAILQEQAGLGAQRFTAIDFSAGVANGAYVAIDPICNILPTGTQKVAQPPYCPGYTSHAVTKILYDDASVAYKYYLSKFNRDGYDGAGSPLTLAYVPKPPGPNNDGAQPAMPEGDYDAFIRVTLGSILLNSDGPAVIVHEMGHLVMLSNGVDGWRDEEPLNVLGEPEAIHEGIADLFAFWFKGSYSVQVPGGTRDATQIMDWDSYPDPHINGLKIGHAAYIAAHGGSGTDEDGNPVTVTPAPGGDNAVAQIFYDTIQTGKISGFPSEENLKDAIIDDASDASNPDDPHSLNGQTIDPHDCGAVMNGFAAVGLGEGDRDNDCVVDLQDDCPDDYDPKQDGTCCPKYLDQLKKNGADIAEATKECNKDPGTPPGMKKNAPTGGGGITPGHWENYSGRADSWIYAEGSILGNIVQALDFNFAHLDCLLHNWGIFNGNYPEYSCEYWVFSDITESS